jgi:hypothetical protein
METLDTGDQRESHIVSAEPPVGTVAYDVSRLAGPLEQLLLDAESAHSTWRTLQPLASRVIDLLKAELEKSAERDEIDLAAANKLLTSITTASKALAQSAGTIVGSFERVVEVQKTLGGGKRRDLGKLPEHELRRIVGDVVREFGLGPMIDVTPGGAALRGTTAPPLPVPAIT